MTRGEAVTYAGWVFKEGSLVRSWKKRFLVAKGADLAYYKNTDKENHAQLLGALTAARIERLPDITNGLLIIGSEGRLLKIFTDTRAESDKCFAAIARYCRDQNRYGGGGGEAQRQPSAGSESGAAKQRVGWLEKEGQHFKTWKKRYFVLSGNRLTYSANIGGETLGAGKVVGARRDPSRPFTLNVTFEGGREMRIGGKSEFDIDDWHKAMRRGILHAHDQHRPSQSQSLSRASEDEQFFRDSEDTGSVPPSMGDEDGMPSPLFGSAPSAGTSFASASSSDLPPPPYSSVEDDQPPPPMSEEEALRHQRAFDRELDAAASFRRHIVVEVAEDNTASFVEVEPERESSEKPFSPTPPGTATIRRMRLAEMLLQEELEEERKEALMKEKTMDRPAGTSSGPDTDVKGPCCCVVM
jgi:hypothetical protein